MVESEVYMGRGRG